MLELRRVADDEPGTATLHVRIVADGTAVDVVLDSGGAGSRLPPHIGSRTTPGRPTRGALGESSVTSMTHVHEIRLDQTVHSDVTVESSTAPPLLGLDLLAQHRLDLVMSLDRLELDGDDGVDEWGPLVLSSHGHPHMDVGWGDRPDATAIWDTGASLTIVDTVFAAAHPDLFEHAGVTIGTDAAGVVEETPLVRMATCTIGGRVFLPTIAAVAPIRGIQPPGDPDFDLIIGYPIIAQADWAIDFPRRRWGFRTESPRTPRPAPPTTHT